VTALYSFLLLPLPELAAAFASTASGERLGLGANSTFLFLEQPFIIAKSLAEGSPYA